MVKYVTYSESKSQTDAATVIDYYLESLSTTFDLTMFGKLCGTICYAMVFNIPEYDLCDGKFYTIEMICFHVPTTLSKQTHRYLDILADFAVNKGSAEQLYSLLTLDELSSIILLGHVNVRMLYCVLVIAYAKLTNDTTLFYKAKSSIVSDNEYTDIRARFSK